MQKQYLLLATLIVGVCNTLPLTAIAQESNCGKAPSTAEQYQCANNELATAEQDLQSAFADALQRYTPKAAQAQCGSSTRQQRAPLCRTSMKAAPWDRQLLLFARLR